MRTEPYRLITRSDFDGLVSAAMLRDIGVVDAVMFVHPKDVQDGKVHVDKDDMLVNLPYVATAGQVFDYQRRGRGCCLGWATGNLVMGVGEASVSRVIYDHFGGESRFPHFSPALMAAVDKAGSASYTLADVLHPRDWTLLGFLADPRTGLGRFHDFRISNLQLMMMLVDACRSMDIGRILALPDVAERVRCYHEHESKAIEQLRRCAHVQGNTVVLDMRNESIIYAGQPLPGLCAVPQLHDVAACDVGAREGQHGVCPGPLHLQHGLDDRHRRPVHALRRWWPPVCRYLPDRQRMGRAATGRGAGPHRERERIAQDVEGESDGLIP